MRDASRVQHGCVEVARCPRIPDAIETEPSARVAFDALRAQLDQGAQIELPLVDGPWLEVEIELVARSRTVFADDLCYLDDLLFAAVGVLQHGLELIACAPNLHNPRIDSYLNILRV